MRSYRIVARRVLPASCSSVSSVTRAWLSRVELRRIGRRVVGKGDGWVLGSGGGVFQLDLDPADVSFCGD